MRIIFFQTIFRRSFILFCGMILILFNKPVLSQADSVKTSAWKITIPTKEEPGEPLIVAGTVYAPDGKTPATGVSVYVYHTDVEGYYRKGNNSSSNPRLKGMMVTNAEGKYEFRTIKPGAYPGGGNPAHIHYILSGKGYAEQHDEVMFQGDPYLTPQSRPYARPLQRGQDGIWRCVFDLKLKQK